MYAIYKLGNNFAANVKMDENRKAPRGYLAQSEQMYVVKGKLESEVLTKLQCSRFEYFGSQDELRRAPIKL